MMRLIRSFLTLILLLSAVSAFAQEPQVVVVNGKKCTVHTVAEGDTLYSLAKRYDVPLKQIMELNSEVEADSMAVGMSLYIPYNVKSKKKSEEPESSVVENTVAEVQDLDKECKRREKRAVEHAEDVVAEVVESIATEAESVAESAVEAVAEAQEQQSEGHGEILGVSVDSLLSFISHGGMHEAAEQERMQEIDSMESAQKIRIPVFKRFNKGEVLNVALMLPMHRNGKVVGAFVDFYRGVLLALEDLRRQGYSIRMRVYDTERTAIKINEIITAEEFAYTDLIVGPVYADELKVVLPLAEDMNIPVITPLSDINPEDVSSPVLFQMQADGKYKYDKYAHIFDGSCQINIVYGPTNDSEYLADVLAATSHLNVRHLNAKVGARGASFVLRNSDGTDGAAVAASSLVSGAGRKAVIIVADRDYHIEKMLMTIGDIAKKYEHGSSNDCYVIGSRKWDGLQYIERTGFYNSGVSMIAPYNSKRTDNDAIKLFESRFLSNYGILPTPYACRGYDAVMLFCTKMFTGLDKYIMLESITPLATTYKFKFEDGMFVNTEWVNIQYQRDFTVVYK